MPQMAPLLWLNLFVMFSATFIIFLILNYFIKVPSKIESAPFFVPTKQINWKW
uniref:ATP synthase complex subunit 8 n=1 Tax=Gennadas parvus TaxID=2291890 RepID=A0A345WJA8_9EUCA|nr:ATP synthase F0 subunit 8 [Gennadas parvus]AXJ93151.1 ATP synthase F0 subunit 8 [Gennadas parvus]